MRARVAMLVYAMWMALLTAVYYAVGSTRETAAAWALISVSGVVAVCGGVALHRPARRRSWFLLASGALLLGLGDTTSLILRAASPSGDSQPWPVDLCYFVMFWLIFFGLLGLSRSGVPERDRAGLLDAATLTAGAAVLSWIYLVSPRVSKADMSAFDTITAIAYPLGMLLIVAMIVRLVAGTRLNIALALVGGGMVALACGEWIFLARSLTGVWQTKTAADLCWVLFYVGCGLAALHPSMTRLGERRLTRTSDLNPQRLAVLSLSALIPSAVLIVMAVQGSVRFAGILGVASAMMVLLVLSRLLGLLRQQWRALARERQLGQAGGALLVATSSDQVRTVVTDAVNGIMPSIPHRTALALGSWPDDGRHTRLYAPRDLPEPYASDMAGVGAVLRCPLTSADGRGRDAELGQLLIGAPEESLTRHTGTLELLAVQTALALKRITLAAEIAKRDAEVYFRTLVHHSTDIILIIDSSGTVRYRSPSASRLFEGGQSDGRSIIDLIAEPDRPLARHLLARMVAGESVPTTREWPLRLFDGSTVYVSSTWRDLRDDPTVAGFVITLRDVTEQRRLERELTYRATHDPLTGLANRALFTEQVDMSLARSRADGAVTGALIIDLDDFKEVNDTMGHLVGDEVLKVVAARLNASVRETDLCARLGGDEFAVLVASTADQSEVDAVAERVVTALSEPIAIGSQTVRIGGSVGTATTASSGDGLLLHDADGALYLAKRDGKGRWKRHVPAPSRMGV